MKSTLLSAILVLCASFAKAAVFDVEVGSGGLTFSPHTVTAAAGDTVVFTFAGKHTLTEAPFSSPCTYLSGGVWSGVQPEPNFVITVTSTDPRFFYCSIPTHCQNGMVFALNPSSNETFEAFQSAAGMTTNSVQPSGGPVGGTSGPVGSSSSASASSTPETSSPTSSPASSTATTSTAPSAAATSKSASSATIPVENIKFSSIFGCLMLAALMYLV